MIRTFVAAILALLAVTAPAQAAFINNFDAAVNLDYGSLGQLVGNIDFELNPIYPYTYPGGSDPYNVASASLTLNGIPLTGPIIGNTGFPQTQTYFPCSTVGCTTDLFGLEVYSSSIPYLSYANFVGATGGTVTALSCDGGACGDAPTRRPAVVRQRPTSTRGLCGEPGAASRSRVISGLASSRPPPAKQPERVL